MDYKTLGERIKQVRNENNLSQDAFGKRIGSARNTIANYENGNRTPSNSVLLSICREFNVSEEWLRTGIGDPKPALPTSDIIARATALLGEHDQMFESLVEVYSKLTDTNRKALFQFLKDFINTHEEKTKDSSKE